VITLLLVLQVTTGTAEVAIPAADPRSPVAHTCPAPSVVAAAIESLFRGNWTELMIEDVASRWVYPLVPNGSCAVGGGGRCSLLGGGRPMLCSHKLMFVEDAQKVPRLSGFTSTSSYATRAEAISAASTTLASIGVPDAVKALPPEANDRTLDSGAEPEGRLRYSYRWTEGRDGFMATVVVSQDDDRWTARVTLHGGLAQTVRTHRPHSAR
jgi:hypothetical protein